MFNEWDLVWSTALVPVMSKWQGPVIQWLLTCLTLHFQAIQCPSTPPVSCIMSRDVSNSDSVSFEYHFKLKEHKQKLQCLGIFLFDTLSRYSSCNSSVLSCNQLKVSSRPEYNKSLRYFKATVFMWNPNTDIGLFIVLSDCFIALMLS